MGAGHVPDNLCGQWTYTEFNKLQLLERVGQGMYGEVFKARNDETGELVALKKLRLQEMEPGIPSMTLRELGFLRHMNHENIVRTYGVHVPTDTRVFIVMEFLGGSVAQLLEKCADHGIQMSVPQCNSIVKQLLSALAYCNQHKIIHRDIKPANILLTPDGCVKLCDFGMARYVEHPTTNTGKVTKTVVTLWWRSPEILLGSETYTAAVDVWSVGIVYVELLTGTPPFQGTCEFEQIIHVLKMLGTPTPKSWAGFSQMPYYNPNFPKFPVRSAADIAQNLLGGRGGAMAASLITQILLVNPVERIQVRNALRHPVLDETAKPPVQVMYMPAPGAMGPMPTGQGGSVHPAAMYQNNWTAPLPQSTAAAV